MTQPLKLPTGLNYEEMFKSMVNVIHAVAKATSKDHLEDCDGILETLTDLGLAMERFYLEIPTPLTTDHPPPIAVRRAIFRKFMTDENPVIAAIAIHLRLRYDQSLGCWYFIIDGMFHGVEVDGYIHT